MPILSVSLFIPGTVIIKLSLAMCSLNIILDGKRKKMLFYTGCKLEQQDYFHAGQRSQWRSFLESSETVFLHSPCGCKSARIMRPLLFYMEPETRLEMDLEKKTEMCLKSISVHFPLPFFTCVTGYETPSRQSSVVALGEHESYPQLIEGKGHMGALSLKDKTVGLRQDIWLKTLRTRQCQPPERPFILFLCLFYS